MRWILLLFFSILLPICEVYAKREFFSPIPLPKQYIDTLDISKCDSNCLLLHYQNGEYFSFLARYTQAAQNSEIAQKYYEVQNELGIILDERASIPAIIFEDKKIVQDVPVNEQRVFEPVDVPLVKPAVEKKPLGAAGNINIAVILPKKVIGRYAITTTKAIMSYLLARNATFSMEVFDSVDESQESLSKTLLNMQSAQFDMVVAVVTKEGAKLLSSMSHQGVLFIPTVLKNEINNPPPNIYFGGLDYKKQLETLLPLGNSKISIFYDNSPLANSLNSSIEALSPNIVMKEEIGNTEKRVLRAIFEGKRGLINDSTIFLNSQMIKSALTLSMLTYYENTPYKVFGTQHLYSPMLFSLTQDKDRENLYIANSILSQNIAASSVGYLIGADLQFDWINYSCSIGVDYFFSQLNNSVVRLYNEALIGNQVMYDTEVLRVQKNSFEKEF